MGDHLQDHDILYIVRGFLSCKLLLFPFFLLLLFLLIAFIVTATDDHSTLCNTSVHVLLSLLEIQPLDPFKMQSRALSVSDFATSSTLGSSLTRRVVPYACGTPGHVDHIACFEVILNGKQMPLDPTIDEQRVKHLTVDACTARADQIYVHLHRCCRTRKRVWAPESGGLPKPLTPEPDWKSRPTPEEKVGAQ